MSESFVTAVLLEGRYFLSFLYLTCVTKKLTSCLCQCSGIILLPSVYALISLRWNVLFHKLCPCTWNILCDSWTYMTINMWNGTNSVVFVVWCFLFFVFFYSRRGVENPVCWIVRQPGISRLRWIEKRIVLVVGGAMLLKCFRRCRHFDSSSYKLTPYKLHLRIKHPDSSLRFIRHSCMHIELGGKVTWWQPSFISFAGDDSHRPHTLYPRRRERKLGDSRVLIFLPCCVCVSHTHTHNVLGEMGKKAGANSATG